MLNAWNVLPYKNVKRMVMTRNGKRGFARVKILIQGKSKRIYELGHKQSASGNF